MAQKYDVAGLGNAIVDVIAATDDEFLLTHNVAKGVMTLIDEYRAHQLLGALPDGREIAGGSAANTMAGLASLGGTGLFVGKVNADRLGESFADSLKQIGVQFDTRMAEGGPQTACCLIAVTPDGQRSMNTYLGACRELTPEDIDEDAIAASAVLYIEGYLWDEPSAKAAIERAMAAAKRAGRKVAFTLSDPFCVERWRSEFRELLDTRLDILFANEAEAKALFEVDSFDEVLQAMRPWKGIAALTRSEKGCVVARGSEVHVLDAAPVAKVVDTTGAGDQYAAGFLYGLTRDKPLAACGKLGALAAAEVISHYGARPEVHLKTLAAEAGLI
ncbi:MAG: adenosine kinase [Alphaproteobacteria bacterium]|nr:adenosine kinase [Alphaproteobacteria bacterium]MBU6472674.1 adenosine kinase [Alphaproteobacteria bacterium]MDE2012281.1 adenosine kinase [Alphaproteobacteria bacterium]MDE2072848.1 adenosine kinase [Alphaproteobacteria bacterium]MDE2351724.1 adenosine kinase [Alphaproteobacteria bacterium]